MKFLKYTVSIVAVLVANMAVACEYYEYKPDEFYFFNLGFESEDYIYDDWKANLDTLFRRENIDFWYNYVKKAVPRHEVEKAMYSNDSISDHERFFAYLMKKNDTTALRYWHTVKDYLLNPWESSLWYYPTKAEMSKTRKNYGYSLNINIIENCKDKNIRNRYALQLMRRAFKANNKALCVEIWQKYARHIPPSALRTQCQSYYAGAVDNHAASNVALAQIGYYRNFAYCSYKQIRAIYNLQPGCKGFEYFVQTAVNAQFDHKMGIDLEKLSAKALKKRRAEFDRLANELVADSRNPNPALWRSGQAAFAYIDGDIQQGLKYIAAADTMKGTRSVKDNIRTMRLILLAADATRGPQYERRMLPDLKWLVHSIKQYETDGRYDAYNYHEHQVKVLSRTVWCEMHKHFRENGQPDRALAYFNLRKSTVNYYDDFFFAFTDTTDVANLEKHMAFLKSTATNAVDSFLIANCSPDHDYFNDMVGTKYLRLEKWDKAIEHLKRVSPRFLKQQGIYPYLVKNNPFCEDHITNQKRGVFEELAANPASEYAKNPTKLNFCRIMKNLQQQCSDKNITTRRYALYAYALGMSQAFFGKEWAITDYYISEWDDKDVFRPGKKELNRCTRLVDKAVAANKGCGLLEKCYYLKMWLAMDEYDEYAKTLFGWGRNPKQAPKFAKQLLPKWEKLIGERLTMRYFRRTFCDRIDDYHPRLCNLK